MKNKNEKGITLISLVITLIILVIITYVTISMGIGIAGDSNFQNIETYMLLIQSRCEFISNELVIGENPDAKIYGKKIESGEYANWYELSQPDLDDMGVKGAKAKDGYYVNYENNDVVYAKGVEYEGHTFYKLSDMISYSDSNNTVQE